MKDRINDKRSQAVSPVIGFVLIIAISAIALTLLQVAAVPIWNEGVEFDHSQEVQNDMQNLRSGVAQVASTGRASTENIALGTSYPRRFLFLNPPPPSGTVSTGEPSAFSIQDAVAIDDETADYWNGSTNFFPTRSITYEPDYNALRNEGSVVYEGVGSVAYKQEEGDNPYSPTQCS